LIKRINQVVFNNTRNKRSGWVLYVIYLNFCLRVESSDYTDVLMPALPASRTAAKADLAGILDSIASHF